MPCGEGDEAAPATLMLVNGNTVFDTNTVDVLSSTTPVRDLCAELS